MSSAEQIYRMTEANRLRAADLLDGLGGAQWETESLCAGWTVHDLAGHLVQPMVVGFGRFFLVSFRYRGNTARTVDHFTRELGRRPAKELVALLRAHAADRVDPPRVGPMGPFADTCIHLRDIARPLGLAADVPVAHWRILLDYLTSPGVAPGLARPGITTGLRLVATDADWAVGEGPEVRGAAEALGLAITGRPAALADLRGDGVEALTRLRR